MKVLIKIVGWALLVVEVAIVALFFVAKGGFAAGMDTISNLFGYGVKVLQDLGNPKYLGLLIGLAVALVVGIILFIVNIKKKKVFVLAPTSVPLAVAIFYVAFRYRKYLNFKPFIMGIAEEFLLILFGVMAVYALTSSLYILLSKSGKTVDDEDEEETKEETPAEEEKTVEEEKPEEAPVEEEKTAEEANEEEKPAEEPAETPAEEENKEEAPVEETPAEENKEEAPVQEAEIDDETSVVEITDEEEPQPIITAEMIKNYVKNMTGENHPAETVVVDRVKERTPDSLRVKTCNLALLYGKDGNLSLLIRLPEEAAEQAKADHSISPSGFAGTHDYYKLPVDETYKTEQELYDILEAAYAYLISKYFKVENGEYVEIEPSPEAEAPAEEEIVEPSPVEEPAEETEEAEEPAETEEEKPSIVIVGPDGKKYYPDRTFGDRLKEADPELLQKYSDLKNLFLSYRKVHSRVTKTNDAFRFEGNLIGKIIVAGKGLKVYLALDPLSVDSAIYHQRDASSKKRFTDTPLVVKVKSPLSYRKACVLIEKACEKVGTEKKSRFTPVDWTKPIVGEDSDEAIK